MNGTPTLAHRKKFAEGREFPERALALASPEEWARTPASSHQVYDAAVKLLTGPEHIYTIWRDYLEGARAQNCLYVQGLSSGLNNCRDGREIEAFETNYLPILKAGEDARAKTGIEFTISPSGKRHHRTGKDAAHRLLEAVDSFIKKGLDPNKRIRGLDLAGSEVDREGKPIPLSQFIEIYEHARQIFEKHLGREYREAEEAQLINLAHAGEVLNADDIEQALRLPGLGNGAHFLSAVEKPELVDELARRRILISMPFDTHELQQPTRFTPASHPAGKLFREGKVPICFGTDDPGLGGNTIHKAYHGGHSVYGFSVTEMALMTACLFRYGVAAHNVRQALLLVQKQSCNDNKLPLPDSVFDLSQKLDLGGVLAKLPGRTPRGAFATRPELGLGQGQ